MKNKHRRLFGQNNRITKHFRYLSAKKSKGLLLPNIIWFFSGDTAFKKCSFAAALLLCVTSATAAQNLSTEQIGGQISVFVMEQLKAHYKGSNSEDIKVTTKSLALVLKNRQCNSLPLIDWRHGLNIGQTTLKIECENYWKAYAPVHVQLFRTVVISATPLERNQSLVANNLTLRKMDVSRLHLGFFEHKSELLNYQLKRTLKAGQVLTPYIVKAPALVKRGDWVTIVSGNSAITVTSAGEAMKDGGLGDQIPIKNRSSSQIIKAWVVEKGLVSTKTNGASHL